MHIIRALVASCFLFTSLVTMAAPLAGRAPHPAAIYEPEPGYTLDLAKSNTFHFRLLDGEQTGDTYSVHVSLKRDDSGKTTLLADIPFDGYVAEKNITLDKGAFDEGAYTLIAEEIYLDDGKSAGTVSQTFNIA